MTCKPILIVEDNSEIRSALKQLLEREGYPVLLAVHGQAALNFLEKEGSPKPGLILLDLTMPVMDGSAFLLEWQRKHPRMAEQIPIFIMTARIDTRQLTLKPTGFIQKPFDVDELYRVAKQYCDVS